MAAFITVNIYKSLCQNNVTIKMPEEVPPNVSQAFKDIIPYGLSILVIYAIDLVIRQLIGVSAAEAILKLLNRYLQQPMVMSGSRSSLGPMHSFWFVGIHGPSIVEPAIAAITYANVETNFQLLPSRSACR